MTSKTLSQKDQLFALVDCNNFYASCERAFNASLNDRPIVVLSNNDGCIIARSAEAKALGIPMGAPYFKNKDVIVKNNVAVFSSNYELYGDMSRRVMDSLHFFEENLEIYSIDEAFLKFPAYDSFEDYLISMRQKVMQWTNIPLSIGVAPTKTLAKLANHMAKKQRTTGVFNGCDLDHMNHLMKTLPVEDIWGISRGWGEKLRTLGIVTALDLAKFDSHHIRKVFSVVLERIVLELRGISCLNIEDVSNRKSICASKSFGTSLTDLDMIEEALATYATRACERMRAQGTYTQNIGVMLRTSPYKGKDAYYAPYIAVALSQPTNDTGIIIAAAKKALKKIFKPGYHYQKAGIMLLGLTSKNHSPQSLFTKPDNKKKIQTQENLMACLDSINKRYGRQTLFYGAQGIERPWQMRCDQRSSRYTTRFAEIPVVL